MVVIRGVLVTLMLAQMVWPILYVFRSRKESSDSSLQLGVGVAFFPIFLYALSKILPKDFKYGVSRKRNFLYYTCCVFAVTGTVTLVMALEALDLIQGYVSYYFEKSEPYLASSYGAADSMWDCTVRFTIYLVIIYKFDNGQDYSKTTLYWVGDMLQGMPCLAVGAWVGNYGENFMLATLFNVIYFVMPIFALKHVLGMQSGSRLTTPTPPVAQTAFKLYDGFLVLGLVFSMAVGFIRGLAALGSPLPYVQYFSREYDPYVMDPGKFGAMHCIIVFVYLIPVQAICAYYLVIREYGRTPENLSIMLGGATAHGAVLHLIASFLHSTPDRYRITENMWTIVFLNIFPVIISHLVMYKFIANKSKVKGD